MPWAADFESRKRGDGCEMCAQGRPEEDENGIRVAEGRWSDSYLQRVARQRGWVVVVWRGRHVAEATQLAEVEALGYWGEVLRTARAVEAHLRPLKMNLMQLGNAIPHLHTHVLPRYVSDTDGGAPFTWTDQDVGSRPDDELRADAAALRRLIP